MGGREWLYSIRVVTPDNQINLLKYLMDDLIKAKPNRTFARVHRLIGALILTPAAT